jgi:cell division septation protein DedD
MQKRREAAVPMPQSMSRLLKIIIGVAVITVITLITWAVWPDSSGKSDESVPIVRADSGDYKVEPEDRGGMPIPNKDSTIFEAMEPAANQEKKVESLLEDTEKPMKKEEVFVGGGMPENSTDDVSVTPSETIVPSQEKEVVEKPVVPEKPQAVVEEKVAPAVVEEKKEDKKIDVIATLKKDAGTDKPKPKEKSVAKGNTFIQLASVKSDADAKAKWSQLKSKYPSLQSLNLRVSRADLGAKGIFYRVQAGSMSVDAAASICSKIKSAGGDCLVVK